VKGQLLKKGSKLIFELEFVMKFSDSEIFKSGIGAGKLA
jgi:hypothetical protein